MRMVRLRFRDTSQEAEGFIVLAKRIRVICFADKTYEIPKSGVQILDDLAIAYEVIAEEGFDRACRALRDSLASQV